MQLPNHEELMITFNVSALILRPIGDVFDYVATPGNNSKWQYGSIASVQISEGKMRVGTLFSSFGHFMGRRIQSTFEVTEFEFNKNYGFKTLSGPVQMQSHYKFNAVERGTNVFVSTQANPGGFFKLVDPIVARIAKTQFKENLTVLKKLLETREIIHNRS